MTVKEYVKILFGIVVFGGISYETCNYIPTISGLAGSIAVMLVADIVIERKYFNSTLESVVPRETVLSWGIWPLIAFTVSIVLVMVSFEPNSFLAGLIDGFALVISFFLLTMALIARNKTSSEDSEN